MEIGMTRTVTATVGVTLPIFLEDLGENERFKILMFLNV